MAPLEIVFRSMEPSVGVETCAQEWLERLEHRFGSLERCTVVIDQPHKHHRQGRLFEVHLHVAVGGQSFAVTNGGHAHEDAYVAIADAFRLARRALENRVEIRRGEVKAHA